MAADGMDSERPLLDLPCAASPHRRLCFCQDRGENERCYCGLDVPEKKEAFSRHGI